MNDDADGARGTGLLPAAQPGGGACNTASPPRAHTAGRRALLAAGALLLAGCGSSPPTRWYTLRLDPPDGDGVDAGAADASASAAAPDLVWELSPSVGLPAALDRDTLLVASGQSGLAPLTGHRWAAPLREAVPRLLLLDLQRLRGPARVWPAPAPAGVQPAWRLRVELPLLLADADRRQVQLQAQWVWQAARQTAGAASPPRTGQARLQVPTADTSPDALAAAHRLLLWQLAQRLVAQAPGRPDDAAAPGAANAAGTPSTALGQPAARDASGPPATSGR